MWNDKDRCCFFLRSTLSGESQRVVDCLEYGAIFSNWNELIFKSRDWLMGNWVCLLYLYASNRNLNSLRECGLYKHFIYSNLFVISFGNTWSYFPATAPYSWLDSIQSTLQSNRSCLLNNSRFPFQLEYWCTPGAGSINPDSPVYAEPFTKQADKIQKLTAWL